MANKGNPAWQKGGPSPNPRGRGVAKAATRAPGSDGVISYGGYVQTNEGSSRLTGTQKWVEFANAWMHPPVAIAGLLRSALVAGTKWSLTEHASGDADAQRAVEVVQRGLLDARLPKPWPVIVRRALMKFFNGFSIHAVAMARRPDGLVAYTDIAERPAHTIDKWFREGDLNGQPGVGAWAEVEQVTQDGGRYRIPLSQCLYLAEDTIGAGPDGPGMLRLVVERLRRISNYEALEGSELFSSMGGMPIARVPLEEISRSVPLGSTADQAAAHERSVVANIETIVSDRVKTPERRQYAVLDSATYQGSDPNTISGIQKWAIEMVKAEMQGLGEMRKVITDLHLDVARMLGVEFAFVGGGDTAGTFGMVESKTDLFSTTLQTNLNELARCADDQLVRPLLRANGLDPDKCAPSMTPARIAHKDVEAAARTLGLIQMAGLAPNHPAKIAMFERMELPWQDEASSLMAPRPFNPGGMP
jgi:hypothetical protein